MSAPGPVLPTTNHAAPASAPASVGVGVGGGHRSAATPDAAPPEASRRLHGSALLTLGLLVAIPLSIILAAALGPADISPITAWRIVLHHLLPESVVGTETSDWSLAQDRIVWHIRVPRALLAVVVGATLSVVGCMLQAMVRNPLADPTILGGTAGASIGAVGVIILGWSFAGIYTLSAAAFVGCLGGYGLTYLLGRSASGLNPLRLVLAGVAVGYLLSAVTNMIIFLADNANAVRSALFWMLGGMGGATWDQLLLPSLLLLGGTVFLLGQARALNALLFGDETATSLGFPPDRLRLLLFIVAAILTGTAVALAGGIGFVGLVVPHVARLLVGSDHRRMLPLAAVLGALFLLWADVLARLLIQPQEIPIGVVTALVGAPAFALLLRRNLRGSGSGAGAGAS